MMKFGKMEIEYWMTSSEAKDYGMIDEVLTKQS